MSESFVDLSYRGLPIGRRIKLAQVRPTTGYLEMPAPMPVGTEVSLATDEGLTLEAVVTQIHEQVGGSDRAPGMTIEPRLAAEAAAMWWSACASLPAEEPAVPRLIPARTRTQPSAAPPIPAELPPAARNASMIDTEPTDITASAPTPPAPPMVPAPPIIPAPPIVADAPPSGRPMSNRAKTIMGTGPQTAAETITADEPPETVRQSRVDSSGLLHTLDVASLGAPDPEGRTTVMPAVDQQLLEDLTREPNELEQLTSTSGQHAIVDDGQRTVAMDAVDPAAIGLEMTASGRFKTIADDPGSSGSTRAATDGDVDDGSDGDKPAPAGGGKKRRKRR